MIMTKTPAKEIRKVASKVGVKSLRDDGLRKVLKGDTTLDEVLRLTSG